MDGLTAWTPTNSRSRYTKTRTSIKNPAQKIQIMSSSLRISGHLPVPIVNGGGEDLEKCNFQNFRSPVTLTLTLDRVIRHTVVHQSSTCMYVPNLIEIRQTFCGRTNGWTDVRTYLQTDIPPSNVIRSTRSRPKNQKLVALLQKWTPVHH